MEEGRVRLLAMLFVIVGLSGLVWFAWGSKDGQEVMEIQDTGIDSVMGKRVSVSGTVVDVIHHGKVSFLRLSPASPFPIVSFDSINTTKNVKVRVTGRVKLYKGKPEIVVEKVTMLS